MMYSPQNLLNVQVRNSDGISWARGAIKACGESEGLDCSCDLESSLEALLDSSMGQTPQAEKQAGRLGWWYRQEIMRFCSRQGRRMRDDGYEALFGTRQLPGMAFGSELTGTARHASENG